MEFYREKVINIMQEKRFSKNKLATLIGVSQTAVTTWLNGKRVPRERNIALIAKALAVSSNVISDIKDTDNISTDISGYFQGWGTSLNKSKSELDDPCMKAMNEIENIKQEQYRLRTVISAFMSTMQSMLYVKNCNSEYIVANESYLKSVGLDIEKKIIGKKDSDIMSQNTAVKNNLQDMAIINTGKPIINRVVKVPFLTKKIKRCIMTKVPLRDNNLNTVGIVASFTDVTGEYELHKKEVMLREAVNRAKTAIGIISFTSTHTHKLVYMNEAMRKILGHTEEEFKKNILCWRKNIVKEDKQKVEDFFNAVLIEETRISFRYKDPQTGNIRNIRFEASGIEGSNLKYCSCFDETEKIKEKLERKELLTGFRLLTSFIDSTNAAVFVGEYSNKTMNLIKYVYRNKKSYEFFDDNSKWGDCIIPEHKKEVLKLSDIDIYPKTMKFNVIKRDGTICSIEERTWLQEENQKTYFFSVFRDIKKQDKIEINFDDNLQL